MINTDLLGKTEVYKVGEVVNANTTFTLSVDINNYKYVLLIGGYGYNSDSSIMPISLFKTFGSSFNVLATYVQIYGGTAFASLSHISDTEIRINGAIGTDCYVACYLIK